MKTLIIGAGNMGLTYAQNFINSNLLTKDHLFFLERTIEKFPLLQPYSHNELMTDPSPLVREMDMIILSVKPQDFPSLAPTLQDYLHPDQLIISIMAGIQIHHIQESLGIPKVIRAMPNLPAQVGMGMTVFTTSQEVSKKDFFIAQNLLSTTGKALYTTDENYLDAATAISGSGPAYVFFFMNSLIKTAKIMGFSEAEAQLLVQQTFLGSVHLLNKNHLSCEEWIRRVSSRGGTTEAAIQKFEAHQVEDKITEGLQAALARAKELAGEK